MKHISKLFALIVVFAICSLAACTNPAVATKKGSIYDVTKGYFSADEAASTLTLDLSDYVNTNGAVVTYDASVQDESLADVSVNDGILSATLLKGEGQSEISVAVNSNGKQSFVLSFTLTATVYDSVVCVGDSLTYGHSWHNQSYPVYLQNALGTNITVSNCGKNGASITGYGGTKMKYTSLPEYTQSLNANPDIVVLMLGTNDATGWANAEATFEQEYRALIATYTAKNPDVQIIIVTSPPTQTKNAFSIPNDVIKEKVNPIQRIVAEELYLPLIDAREIFEAHENGYDSLLRTENGDGVHFSVAGAQFFAELVANKIKSL